MTPARRAELRAQAVQTGSYGLRDALDALDAAEAERDAARAEVADLREALEEARQPGPVWKEIDALAEKVLGLGADVHAVTVRELAAAREALRPFAKAAPIPWTKHPCLVCCFRVGEASDCPGGVCVECGLRAAADEDAKNVAVTIGDLRRARAALGEGGSDG